MRSQCDIPVTAADMNKLDLRKITNAISCSAPVWPFEMDLTMRYPNDLYVLPMKWEFRFYFWPNSVGQLCNYNLVPCVKCRWGWGGCNIVHQTITLASCNNGVGDGYCSLGFDRLHSYQQVISSIHL